MSDEGSIALIVAGATIAGGLLGQVITVFYQGRLNSLERIRIVQARATQLYDREIRAYDAIVPGMAGMLYVARELARDPLLRRSRQNDAESLRRYRELQKRAKSAVEGHFQACGDHFHIIGPAGVNLIDNAARTLYRLIDECTAPIGGGAPITAERAAAILLELETLRNRMLEWFWTALDTAALESSFRAVHEPLDAPFPGASIFLQAEIGDSVHRADD